MNPADKAWFARIGLAADKAPTPYVVPVTPDGNPLEVPFTPAAWAPKTGDVAAATFAAEHGAYVE